MATEAQRAPCVARGQTNAAIAAVIPEHDPADTAVRLRIFDAVPALHGVIAVEHDSAVLKRGEVAVYDTDAFDRGPLVDGGIYVIEYQHAVGHLPQRMWADTPNLRMVATRRLIVARQRFGLWSADPLRTARPGQIVCSDGPYREIFLRDKLVGRVVGIYNPAALAGLAQ